MHLFRAPMRYVILLLIILGCKPVAKTIDSNVSASPEVTDTKIEPKKEPKKSEKPDLSNSPGATYDEVSHWVGDEEIMVATYRKGKGLTFINLHDDENTSVIAASAVIDSLGGTLIQLRHTGERNVVFNLDGREYIFDPNRMFTDLGAENSLQRFSSSNESAHQVVRDFADKVVEGIRTEIIFTLHNNSEDKYSARSYLDEYKSDAADVYLNPNRDPDDFYFVTEPLFFDSFKARGYNVVLQNNETATDDGSLSVLAAKRGIPYINIEAQHGHLAEQINMLLTVYELFN